MLHRGPGFFRSDRGQDLAEYCLLTALVVLVAAAIFLYVSGGIHNLWASPTPRWVARTRRSTPARAAGRSRRNDSCCARWYAGTHVCGPQRAGGDPPVRHHHAGLGLVGQHAEARRQGEVAVPAVL